MYNDKTPNKLGKESQAFSGRDDGGQNPGVHHQFIHFLMAQEVEMFKMKYTMWAGVMD